MKHLVYDIIHLGKKGKNRMTKGDASILIVDDNEEVLTATRMLLKRHYKTIITETNPERLPELMAKNTFSVVLLDMNFTRDATSGQEGFHWLEKIKKLDANTVVILFTAFGDMTIAIEAIKNGANDFILKPWQNEKLLATIASSVALSSSKRRVEHLSQLEVLHQHQQNKPFEQLIADSPAMQQVFAMVEKAARTDANVLILGESGTGKEVIARALHQQSLRKDEVFLNVDMGSISTSLFESELFGHKKGAFTDAKADRKGRFELAQQGSLFLDEIGNLDLASQAKLLSAIQNRKITPVGGTKELAVDIRLISATNMPLYDMVRENTFRQDLLYRINTVEVHLPPLRQRTQDIPTLVNYYVNYYADKYKLGQRSVDDKTMEQLCSYAWPGNIRELQHLTERAVILADDHQLSFQLSMHQPQAAQSNEQTNFNLAELEQKTVELAVKTLKGNVSHAAKALGITRTSLYRKMEKYGL